MGISADDLATLSIKRIIFHDIPKKIRGTEQQPTLSAAVTEIDASRGNRLKRRLAGALSSKLAYDIEFIPGHSSPVPGIVGMSTEKRHTTETFVQLSQQLARHLHELQTGTNSAGLLTVIDCICMSRPALSILKLEREAGFQLERKEDLQTFAMSVLDNLVLTDGTRLFKSALFVRSAADQFSSVACDDQRGGAEEMAQFWMTFLGCRLVVDPSVITRRFFDATVAFISDEIQDSVEKNDVYEHLLSEYKSEKRHFSPGKFIEDYIPEPYQQSFHDHLENTGIPLRQFPLDVSEIKSKLKRRYYVTERGAVVSVPEGEDITVHIRPQEIAVEDTVKQVK